MSMRNAACLLLATAAFTAAAEPPREGVLDANHLLQQGKPDAALQAYRNLQIDEPESELLYFNIGCAQLETADEPATEEDSVAAVEALSAAKASFDKAAMAEHPDIRRDARFNRVNCDSRLAKQLAASGDHEAAVSAFEDSIYGYEDFLEQYPGHPGAEKNLNHMRYLLKKMLQNPPPEQEQQQQSEEQEDGEENQSGDEQDQQNEDSGEQDGEPQGQPEDDPSPTDAEQEQPGDQSDQEQEGDENEQQQSDEDSTDEGQSSGNAEGDQQQAPGENQSDATSSTGEEPVDLPNKETIEAILEALQERDKQEQQNMRRVPQNPRRSGPWW